VFNGAPIAAYTPVAAVPADAPLAFLGRLDPIKGVHHAIAIARTASRRLVIAGTRQSNDRGYFERDIAPHLSADVTYIGELDDRGKNALLGSSAALLMPIEWDEPFGIVMAEALACGTPVIGFRRGSVPEVVRDGQNGYVCDTVPEAAAAVARVSTIDRRAVRADYEARFSDTAIVAAYEALYAEMRA
jgi:glycosyltransferase involved in cell wall biosynthesis